VTDPRLPRLLLLTDRSQLPDGRELVDTVGACVEAGLEAVMLRELDLPDPERRSLAAALASAGATVITARTWLDGAAGVHLSATQTGLDARPAPFHGRSCHDDEEVRRAVGAGASYLTISPVAASASKPGHGPALGARGVRRAADLAGRVPVFALGGVDAANAAAMRDAGAHGVAVMGAVMRADDPAAAFTRIAEALA
jgi:thiamine-phosphate pyrophosphorylase